MKDVSRKVSLLCPVCGNDMFESLDCDFEELYDAPSHYRIQCSDCKGVFSKEKLLESNEGRIDENLDDMKDDIMKQLEKELKKTFK